MSAAVQERSIPFQDPAIVPLAEAVAAGDIAGIRRLAPSADLSARGRDGVTLLEWAVWNERPRKLSSPGTSGIFDADRQPVAITTYRAHA